MHRRMRLDKIFIFPVLYLVLHWAGLGWQLFADCVRAETPCSAIVPPTPLERDFKHPTSARKRKFCHNIHKQVNNRYGPRIPRILVQYHVQGDNR